MPESMPTPRVVRPLFEDVPRHWLAKNRLATHIANGVNLLFPAGERFFVRSVHYYLDQLDDPILRQRVKGFFGQEGRHAHAHEGFFSVLEKQGFRIKGFLKIYQGFCYHIIERFSPPSLRLSATVAAEHFTAVMADNALTTGLLEELAHPSLRELLLWHAAEEIEHKSVAFDVLQKVNPSYALRMAGLALSATLLAGFWIAAVVMLMRQDKKMGPTPREGVPFQELQKRDPMIRRVFVEGIRSYLKRDFHPSQHDNWHLAKKYLEQAGLAV